VPLQHDVPVVDVFLSAQDARLGVWAAEGKALTAIEG